MRTNSLPFSTRYPAYSIQIYAVCLTHLKTVGRASADFQRRFLLFTAVGSLLPFLPLAFVAWGFFNVCSLGSAVGCAWRAWYNRTMNSDLLNAASIPPKYQPHQPHPWARRVYAAVLYLLIPLLPLYLLLRARKQPEYRQHWAERFACYRASRVAPQKRRIWLHAVSLGETRATKPLVDALFAQHRDVHIILTCHTPTGRAAGQELFQGYLSDGRMSQVYVPYDLNLLLNRFFKTFAPTDVWVMETEVWPSMIAQCVARGIPISLINGRLSDKTLRQTQKWPKLMGNAYAGFTHVCAQTPTDAQRYRQIGVADAQLVVTGNLKFDMRIPTEQVTQGERIKALLADQRIVMLASSREGEEAAWLAAIQTYERTHSQGVNPIQWWIVPRHPQRFDEIAQLLQSSGKVVVRKSEWQSLPTVEQSAALQKADIVLGDTMGEMFAYYAVADVVLMGGTWLPYGGQNFLEPMALGKPVIVGESIYNFEQIGVDAVQKSVLWQAQNFEQALPLAQRTPAHQSEAIFGFVQQQIGVAEKLLKVLFESQQNGSESKNQ